MQGNIVNTISAILPENMEMFIEAWEGEDEADYCSVCGELGILDGDTLRFEHPVEEKAYLATLPYPVA